MSHSAVDGTGFNLAAAYDELHNLTLDASDVRDFLQRVASLACDIVEPPAVVGITLRRGDQVSTVGASAEGLARQADELQYERSVGPCLQAMDTGETVLVSDMTAEARWDGFPAAVVELGLTAAMSMPLIVRGESIGAMNVYSQRTHVYTDIEVERGRRFAAGAASALALVLRRMENETLTEQLQEALVTRAAIDQAMGIVMGREGCSSSEAFATLRKRSQNANRKMYDVAVDLIADVTGYPFVPPRPFTRDRG